MGMIGAQYKNSSAGEASGLDPITPAEVVRKIRFQDRFLKPLLAYELPPMFDPVDRVLIGIVAFEGAYTQEAFDGIRKGLASTKIWGNAQYVAWSDGGRTERRELSKYLILLLRGVDPSSLAKKESVFNFKAHLGAFYGISSQKALACFLADALAWGKHELPRAISSVCCGDLKWSALSKDVWDRRLNVPSQGAPLCLSEVSVEDLGAVLDGSPEAKHLPVRRETEEGFTRRLAGITSGLKNKEGNRLRAESALTHVCSNLKSLADSVHEVGPIEALLLGWICNLILYGTAARTDPVVSTLSRYLNSVPIALYDAIRDHQSADLNSIGDIEWAKILTTARVGCSKGTVASAALRTFERFLLDEGHIESPLGLKFGRPADHLPRANVIWPHEYARALTLLQEIADVRLRQQVPVMLRILQATNLRITELEQLDLRSIRDLETKVEVCVRKSTFVGGNKSPSAVRTMLVSDPEAVAAIQGWVGRRKAEGCELGGLLFGDPRRGDEVVYRHGSCRQLLASSLKRATGDKSVNLHTTRHSSVSIACEGIPLSNDDWQSALTSMAVETGHAGPVQTVSSYAHLLESPIRRAIDLAIERMPITYASIARWVGEDDVSIRQYAKRNGLRDYAGRHKILRDRTCGVRRKGEVQSLGYSDRPEALAPDAVLRPNVDGLHDVLQVLAELAGGREPESVSLRCSLSLEVVDRVRHLAQVSLGLYEGNNADLSLSASLGSVRFSALGAQSWREFMSSASAGQRASESLRILDRWILACRQGGINLHRVEDAVLLVNLLIDSGAVSKDAMQVRVAHADGDPLVDTAPLEPILLLIQSPEPVVPAAHRSGRPQRYLTIFGKRVNARKVPPNRSSLMPDLRGALTALHVYLSLNRD